MEDGDAAVHQDWKMEMLSSSKGKMRMLSSSKENMGDSIVPEG
jgi:hypothetical protein